MPGMIVAPQARAVEIGASILEQGGNAIDAAVSTAFAQGVLDPLNCGVAGFGSFTIYWAGTGELETISFHGRAGSRVTEDMWQDLIVEEYREGYGYHLRDFLNDVGYLSITVPGTVAGLSTALAKYGTRPWADCIAPAIPRARDGFPLTPRAAARFFAAPQPGQPHPMARPTATPGARAIFTRDGHAPWLGGEVFVQADYARTLERLADRGVDAFYHGALAEAMATDFGRHGGFITLDDLRGYRPRLRQPLVGSYRGYTVVTDPPPSGGMTLLEMLNIVEGYDLSAMTFNSEEYIDLLARTMQWAYRDWANHLADPEFAAVPVERLTSKAYAEEARRAIDRGEGFAVPRWRANEAGTTHVSVVDQWGNAVALTHSLGASSGVVTDGLGFQYNNCMNCFNPVPGHPNSIAPGKARVSGLTPTIVLQGHKPVLVLGAPGGTRITTGVFQTILNVLDFGMTATEAVSAPRFDCQGPIIDVEARISEGCSGREVVPPDSRPEGTTLHLAGGCRVSLISNGWTSRPGRALRRCGPSCQDRQLRIGP
jgi:gamma-glutamyltranspeptidase/glutathione hydrolase